MASNGAELGALFIAVTANCCVILRVFLINDFAFSAAATLFGWDMARTVSEQFNYGLRRLYQLRLKQVYNKNNGLRIPNPICASKCIDVMQ